MTLQPAQIQAYLYETLGLVVALRPWTDAAHLPAFLREGYAFLETEILGRRHLLMVDDASDETAPTRLSKQVVQVEAKTDAPVVYVRERMTTINRKRLIEHKVSFIVPGSQLYLPGAGVELHEHVRQLRRQPDRLGPAAQVVVLDMLLGDPKVVRTPGAMARRLDYPAMAMTRAFDELEALKIGKVERQGRERRLICQDSGLDLWRRVQPMLGSPVRSRHFILPAEAVAGRPAAGLDALARGTALARPKWPVVAVSRAEWKMVQAHPGFKEQPDDDGGSVEVEVWNYPPALFVRDGAVDPLSLWLSLAHLTDERVEGALETLIESALCPKA